jgi:GrpB-like predicted nucleotidyltransferase (UPF0157 family)
MATSVDNMPAKPWRDIIREVEQENNPVRIRALAHELNEAMLIEERNKVQQRLGSTQVDRPSPS